MSKTSDVGYKKPPKEYQFKPGKSGNPKGRKRKPLMPFGHHLAHALWKKVSIPHGTRTRRVTMMEVIAMRLTMEASKDLKAAKFLAELTNNFNVPLPEELGVIYVTRNERRLLDLRVGTH